jgi:uncharacterized membrane protein
MEKPTASHHQVPTAWGLFKPSYEALLFNLPTFIALAVMVAAAFIAVGLITHFVHLAIVSGGAVLVALVFAVIVQAGLVVSELKSVRRTKISASEALNQGMYFAPRLLGLEIIFGLMTVIGLILLIVPGVIVINRYFLSQFHMVDQDLGIVDALKASAAESKGYAWKIWGVLAMVLLISLTRVIPYIGMIITIVLSILYICAQAQLYESIREARGKGHRTTS